MAALPWWSWLGVGFVVVFVSLWVEMDFFVWVGVLFIIVGIARLAMIYVLSPKEDKVPVSLQRVSPQVSPRLQEYVRTQKLLCPRCMANLSAADFFCRYCGTKVR